MSSTYSANPSAVDPNAHTEITIPSDGDPLNVASVNSPGPFESIANVEEYLMQQALLSGALACNVLTLPTSLAECACFPGIAPSSGRLAPNKLIIGNSNGTIYSGPWFGPAGLASRSNPFTVGPVAVYGLASNGTVVVAVGAGGTIASSADSGTTWTSRTSGTIHDLHDVCWSSTLSLFIAVGDTGTILTSPTGTTWTSRTGAGSTSLSNVVDGDGTLIAIPDSGTTYFVSTNATSWASHTLPVGRASTRSPIIYSEAQSTFYFATSNGHIYSTPDSTTWTSEYTPPSSTDFALGGTGRLLVAVSQEGLFLTSIDGGPWSPRTATFSGGTTAPAINFSPQLVTADNGSILILMLSDSHSLLTNPVQSPR